MNLLVLSNDLIITFWNWDLLGINSYLLINFWSSKANCGIKALVYNKVGDCLFLMFLVFMAIFYTLTAIKINYLFNGFAFHLLYIVIIYFTKSAQFPWTFWLLNAMTAPTPISSLLHSSTMVIAGVYLGLVLNGIVVYYWICFYHVIFYFIGIFIIIIISLLFSLFNTIWFEDIKSIIAFSTINQVSYLFVSLFGFCNSIVLFHIIIHGLFKSLVFMVAGSLIHIQLHFQSIFKIRVYCFFIKVIIIIISSVLILSFSKEAIIHYGYVNLASFFISINSGLGIIFTTFYCLKIYSHVITSSLIVTKTLSNLICSFYLINSLVGDRIFKFGLLVGS